MYITDVIPSALSFPLFAWMKGMCYLWLPAAAPRWAMDAINVRESFFNIPAIFMIMTEFPLLGYHESCWGERKR